MLIVFHSENAGSFSHGFSDRLDIEADVVIQAEEVAEEDDFERMDVDTEIRVGRISPFPAAVR